MSGRLLAHCGAQYIDRECLRALETPPATDTWTPIPHYDLIVALEGQLKARGISIVKEQFAVQQAKLFGVIDTDYQVTKEGGAAIGIRTANDKSLALQLAIGYRLFICDNMAFHGDLIALKRKHTANLDLHTEFATGIGRYVQGYGRLQENITWWKERIVPKERGKQLIYDIFSQKIVPVRLFHPAVRDWEATENKTMWSLQNAVSNHIKTLKPAPAFTSTLKLSRFFEKVG
jgi:Domain of unknown function (DUF932)